MSEEMRAAFLTGSGFAVDGFYLLVASLLAAGLFIWGAWVMLGHYLHWAKSSDIQSLNTLLSALLSVLIIITVVVGFL